MHAPLVTYTLKLTLAVQEADEAVADWWQRPPVLWQAVERGLACGATAVADLRAAVAAELGYSCSAGVAHNKVLLLTVAVMLIDIKPTTSMLLRNALANSLCLLHLPAATNTAVNNVGFWA